jgi:hypothetical protein
MWHHILIQIGHDHERARENQKYHKHAKRERLDIAGLSGPVVM